MFKKNLIFIDDSPFVYVSNGRDNWLYNILINLSQDYSDTYTLNVICRKPHRKRKLIYNLDKNLGEVKIKRIPFVENINFLYRILDKLSKRVFNILIRGMIFSILTGVYLAKNVNGKENIIFALNPGFEVLPAIFIKKYFKKDIKVYCIMKGLVAEESYQKTKLFYKTFRKLENYTLKNCDKVFANGLDSKNYLKQEYNIESTVIPNGINLWEFDLKSLKNTIENKNTYKKFAELRKIKSENKIIMQTGSISEYKGVPELLVAIKKIKNRGNIKNFKLVLVGKNNKKITEAVANEGLQEFVTIIDEVPREYIPKFLNEADIITNLSTFGIGISMACLEGLASNKPNITWDNPIYNQFINDEALKVTNGDTEQLALAIEDMLLHTEKYNHLLEKSRILVSNFSWESITKKLVNLIESA